MGSLRRHQLARLSPAGWASILARPWDLQARECLAHWSANGLPLVVARQPDDAVAHGSIALGLPAPSRWGRRRLALQVARAELQCLGEFPCLAEVLALVSSRAQCALRELVARLDACQAQARVFGSHGWQAISGLDHVRPGSDLDLSITVDDTAQADTVAVLLQACDATPLRLDGELVFNDGAAVAWREWIEWRAGHARAVLVKRLHGVRVERNAAWCGQAELST